MLEIKDYKDNLGCSIGITNILAFVMSWYTWHSVPWAIVHGIFGIWYIIYWVITNI